jgi:cell wall-associated NlpC family hydrolase
MKKLTREDIVKMLNFAISMIGVPYIWGGQSKNGVDCSGFIQLCLNHVGIDPSGDQTAQLLQHWCLDNKYQRLIKPGSLLFFGKKENIITHVAMALDNELMIEAGGGNQKCTTIEWSKKIGARVRMVPINNRKDLVSYFYLGRIDEKS